MQSLKDVIASICQEIDNALASGRPTLQGRPLESERVVLSLQVAMHEETMSDGKTRPVFEVLSSGTQDPNGSATASRDSRNHQITLELKPGGKTTYPDQGAAEPVSEAGVEQTVEEPVTIPEADADQVTDSLSEIFGAPGFDSSARASVFREALTGLSDEQVRVVIDSLDKSPPPQIDDVLHQARHIIYNVLSSGPTESVSAGKQWLAPLFQRYSVASLLRLIEKRWKTQLDWLDG